MIASVVQIAILTLASFLVCVHLAPTLREFSPSAVCRTLHDSVRWARNCITACTQVLQPDPLDIINRRVAAQMECRRTERRQVFMRKSANAFCIIFVVVLAEELSGKPRFMNSYQDSMLVVGMFFCVIGNSFTRFCSGTRGAVLISALWALLSMWVFAGGTSIDVAMKCFLTGFIIRMTLSLHCLDFGLTATWNTLACFANIYKYSQLEASPVISFRAFCFYELVITTMAISSAHGVIKATVSDVRQGVVTKAQSIEQSAVTGLLDMVCDVTLSLDSELKIIDHAPSFAAMVMMDANRSLRGMKFQQFISSDEDRLRFETQMVAGSFDVQLSSHAFNVTLRESNGTSFNIELFCVPFEGLDHSTQQMVGIREFSDWQPSALKPSQGSFVKHTSKEPAHHGTSPVLKGEKLTAEANPEPCLQGRNSEIHVQSPSMSSVSVTSGSSGMQLAYPHLQETSKRAKEATLIDAMTMWNIYVPKKACCGFHAAQREAVSSLRILRDGPCEKTWYAIGTDPVQCRRCGSLDVQDEIGNCFLCANWQFRNRLSL